MSGWAAPDMGDSAAGDMGGSVAPRCASTAYISTPVGRTPRRPPGPPPQSGILLEWSQPSAGQILVRAAVVASVVAAVYGGVVGAGWTELPLAWVLLGVGTAVCLCRLFTEWTGAGARWVQQRAEWVHTYELTRIRTVARGPLVALRLEDSAGRVIQGLRLCTVQANPAMWNLVYDGLAHSVVSGGCEIDARARVLLRLPTLPS